MKFYTYYKQWGNNIFFSYIDEDGNQHHTKVSDYEPTLYLKTDEESEFKSIYGHNVKPVKLGSIKEAKDFIERYKDVDGMDVEGNEKFASQFVIELFEGKMPEYVEEHMKGCILDIEVTAPEFPTPTEAKYQIDLMTLYNTRSKVFKVFSLHDYDQSIDDTDAAHLTIDFKKYSSEAELLFDFLNYMKEESFNWISGWNSNGFDIPYIVNRCKQVHGKLVNKLSPYGIVNTREHTDDYGNPAMLVDIIGLPQLDYMLMYKKHIYTPRESYRLDFICEAELGKRKLDHEEEGSLYNLSRTNPQKYVSYNIIDVLRLVELEQKLGLFPVMYVIAYYAMSNLESGLSTVEPWENFIAKELYIRGMVPPARDNTRMFRPFVGAYVAEVQVGHHENVVAFDLNSLYPHIMMQVGISPETHIPRSKLPTELIELQDKLAVRDRSTYFLQCSNLVNKEEDLSLLKKHNVSMSASGQFYSRDKKGIIPILAEELYKDRSGYKGKMLDAERELESAKKNNASKEELNRIEGVISRYNNLQMAIKILLNSLYGALGNKHFLYFLIENAEAITTTGQVVNLWTSKRVNHLLNTLLGNEKEKNYVVAGDTDSSYFGLSDIVKLSDMSDSSDGEIADFLDNIVKEVITPEINTYTDELCDYLNNVQNKMVWGREAIAKSAIFCAKKHYAMLVVDNEGVRYTKPKLKIVGLESKKSNTPAWARPMLEDCYLLCLNQQQDEFYDYIENVQKKVRTLNPSEIAIPSGVNGIEKYVTSDMTYTKGTPKHVKAAIVHNRLISKHNLKHIDTIKSGGNLKYVSLKKPNPINEDVVGFEVYLPAEFGLDKFIDYDDAYEKGFEKPLKNFITAIGWETEPVIGLF